MTNVPAPWVSGGAWAPGVCARHGEPAATRAATRFISRPPGWAYPLAIFGGLVFVIVVNATRKTVPAPSWPYCPRCGTRRTVRLAVGLGAVVLGLLGFIAGVALASRVEQTAVAAIMVLAGLAVLLFGIIFATRSSRNLIAGGVVTQDALWVQFARTDPRFDAEVTAALQRAGEMQAAAYAQWQAQNPASAHAQPAYGQPVPPQQYGPAQPLPYGQQPQYGPQSSPYGQTPPS